jgi:alanyl-tRNA synthetase
MGLERVAAVLQGVHSNYEIDLFQDLIRAAGRETGAKDLKSPSLKVIADHIRACSFLIVDGVIPGNDGRGYVLRRSSAGRSGTATSWAEAPFFHKLVADLDRAMGDAYPELREAKDRVRQTLRAEEEKFAETLENGMKLFDLGAKTEARGISYIRDHFITTSTPSRRRNPRRGSAGSFTAPMRMCSSESENVQAAGNVDAIVRLVPGVRRGILEEIGQAARMYIVFHGDSEKTPEELLDKVSRGVGYDKVKVLYLKEASIPFDGRTAFTLYDTYGFPFDLTQDLCREKGIPGRRVGVRRGDARATDEGARGVEVLDGGGLEYSGAKTEFRGYETLQAPGALLRSIARDPQFPL